MLRETDDITSAWNSFLKSGTVEETVCKSSEKNVVPVQCGPLIISTKTRCVQLSRSIDINSVFWRVPVLEYWEPREGVVLKQMKVVLRSTEELQEYLKRRNELGFYRETQVSCINVSIDGFHQFKDERNIVVGMTRKDLQNARRRERGTFCNCFSLMVRVMHEGEFREVHAKIYNRTGNVKIPGVLDDALMNVVTHRILKELQDAYQDPSMDYIRKDDGMVLMRGVIVNSNFSCGFHVRRDVLLRILREDYGMTVSYDPSTYSGLKCRLYLSELVNLENSVFSSESESEQDGKEKVTFTIFRTGNCLISGNCSDVVLARVHAVMSHILLREHARVVSHQYVAEKQVVEKPRTRKQLFGVDCTTYCLSLCLSE